MRRGLWLAFVFCTTAVFAQSPAMKPFEVNMDRVKVSAFGGNFATTTTYLIPTVNLQVSVQGSVWAKSNRAKAHAKYYVEGASKVMLQGLAKKIQDDLVARLRGAGYTVLTYDDVKGEPDVASHSRNTIDKRYDVPTTGGLGAPVTFVLANPSDEQSFTSPIQGAAWWLRDIAKAKNLTVIVPELTFTTPQMFGEASSTAYTDSAGISTDPSMIFEGAKIIGQTPKGGSPAYVIQQHGKRKAAESAGTIVHAFGDRTHVNHIMDTTTDDYVMTLDETAFTDGILRVAFAVNDVLVKEIVKEHR